MVLVLGRNLIAVDVGIHEAVGRISGHSHQATKVTHKHGEEAHLTWVLACCLL